MAGSKTSTVRSILRCLEGKIFTEQLDILAEVQRAIILAETQRVQHEQTAKAARTEEMKRATAAGADQMQCGVCRAPAAGVKCTKCKTICWAKVLQAKNHRDPPQLLQKNSNFCRNRLKERLMDKVKGLESCLQELFERMSGNISMTDREECKGRWK